MYISMWKLLHVPCLSPRHVTCLSISRKCVTRKNHKYDLLYSKYSRFEAWTSISIFKISVRKGDDYGETKKVVLITSSHPFLQWTNQNCINSHLPGGYKFFPKLLTDSSSVPLLLREAWPQDLSPILTQSLQALCPRWCVEFQVS